MRKSGYGGSRILARIVANDGSFLTDVFAPVVGIDHSVFGADVRSMPDGGFVLVWEAFTSDAVTGETTGIRARRFDALGRALTPEIAVRPQSTVFTHRAPAVAVLKDGGFVVVWERVGPKPNQILGRRFAADGTPIGHEFTVASRLWLPTAMLYNQSWPRVEGLSDGGFVVAWTGQFQDECECDPDDYREDPSTEVAARVYDALGFPKGERFFLNAPTKPAYGRQMRPVLQPLPGGGFVAAWGNGTVPWTFDITAVLAQRFDNDGNRLGGRFLVQSGLSDSLFPTPRMALLGDRSLMSVGVDGETLQAKRRGTRYFGLDLTFDVLGNDGILTCRTLGPT